MGQLIQGIFCNPAHAEEANLYELFIELGHSLYGKAKEDLKIPEGSESIIFDYYLLLRSEYTFLDSILEEFDKVKDKKNWVKELKNKHEYKMLIQKMSILWKSEIVPFKKIKNIQFVAVDRYFPQNPGSATTIEFEKVEKVIAFVEIKINGEPVKEIDLKGYNKKSIRVEANITVENEITHKTYSGEVGPELMPFRVMDANKTFDESSEDLINEYLALPKVVYSDFDVSIVIELGHIFLLENHFSFKKRSDTNPVLMVLMQPVWYTDPYVKDEDDKIIGSRTEVTSVVVHHTNSTTFSKTLKR